MKNSVFGKTIENVIKHGDIKLVTTEKRRKKNSHKTKWFSENLLAIEMKKNESKNEQPSLLRSIDIGYSQDSDL